MRAAGFRYVFLGIENILEEDLAFLRAAARTRRAKAAARSGNATLEAIELLHRHGMFVVGGSSSGIPDDTSGIDRGEPRVRAAYVDWPYIQHPTPYPGTPMTKDFRERDLIVNENVERVRRDDRRRAERASRGRGDRVHALARRALDEGCAIAGRSSATIRGSCCVMARRCCAHVPRQLVAIGDRPRGCAGGIHTLQSDPTGRTTLPRRQSRRQARVRFRNGVDERAAADAADKASVRRLMSRR